MKLTESYQSGQPAFRWVVLLLLIAVVLPTVCLLWFMTQAVRNERLAMRQKLTDEYKVFLADHRGTTHETWTLMLGSTSPPANQTAAGLFAFLLDPNQASPARNCHLSGALILDPQGKLHYPAPQDPEGFDPLDRPRAFAEPWDLEFAVKDFAAAALAYEDIATHYLDATIQFRAAMAAVRCWRKLGAWDQAMAMSEKILKTSPENWPTEMLSYVQLRVQWLEMLKTNHDPGFPTQLAAALRDAVDYQGTLHRLSSLERQRFQQMILKLSPELIDPNLNPTVEQCRRLVKAEAFSLRCSQEPQNLPALESWSPLLLQPISQEILTYAVRLDLDNWTALLLMEPEGLARCIKQCIGFQIPKGLTVQVVASDGTVILPAAHAEGEPLVQDPLSPYLPGWVLKFYLDDQSVFAIATQRQTTLYGWIAVLVTGVVIALALVLVRTVGRQVQLNRLKNDFIATITHELKTPLASMRLLLDTLLEGRYRDPQQVTDYLKLMGKENHRLTGLIDNFLTFSRMERNKQSFSLGPADPAELARDAGAAVETKFSHGQCHFTMKIEEDLPDVWADPDAWVTVLINLLENAWKYSGDHKQIEFRVFARDGDVCFSVTDNGVGIPRRCCHRIFDKFYQVDRSLSRQAEGCGLGLSIVKFIVTAHQGTVTVESQVAVGSTFTVTLPIHEPGIA